MPRLRRRHADLWVAGALVALLGASWAPLCARSQIYTFDKVPFPDPRTLHTLYVFYAYSHQDAPEKNAQPFVKFHGLQATPKPGIAVPSSVSAVQISILPFTDLWTLIDPAKFCSSVGDVEGGRAKHADELLLRATDRENIFSATVRFDDGGKDVQSPIRFTGVYLMAYTNCGDFVDATVSGSVILKNAYGFLPGVEYHKLKFYGWVSLVYTTLAVVWMGLSLKWWRELVYIHNAIAVAVCLGLLEAFLFWAFYNDWNVSGTRSTILFVLALFASVLKTVFSCMFMLVVALGWGVTRPYLDQKTVCKVQALSVLYIITDFIRATVLSFRDSHSLAAIFVVLCLVPQALLNGGVFYWMFMAFSNLTQSLRERRQTDKLALFERLGKTLAAALGCSFLVLLGQIMDLSRNLNIRWHNQWFFTDGGAQMIYIVVLGAVMYLWAPGANSQRYMYSQASDGGKGDEKGGNEWAMEDVAEDRGDDDSFWATKQSKESSTQPRPETVGAAED